MSRGIRLKSRNEIVSIYRSGQIAAKLMLELSQIIRPGITTLFLDEFAEKFISKHSAYPAFKGYQGFPSALCTSINEQVVHGIPSDKVFLKEGDILKIDVGVVLDGFYSDTARTFIVDGVYPSEEAKRLVEATQEALDEAIKNAVKGKRLSAVSTAISNKIKAGGFKIIRELTGHGVGFALHEPPVVHNFPTLEANSIIIRDGLVIAIEPMASVSCEEVVLGKDNWTYSTADGSASAHFEHTIAVFEGEPLVLTGYANEKAEAILGIKEVNV